MTRNSVKESLIEQIKLQGKTSDFYVDLINDYMSLWDLKEMLYDDIKTNGLRLIQKNGNGFETEKKNDSVADIQKTTATMLKILNDLNLKEPLEVATDDDYM